jgi:hypothetical protein
MGCLNGTDASIRRYDSISNLPEGGLAMLVGVLVTFLVIILVLYLINMLPMDGRAKQIARVVVIIIGIVSLLKYLAVF